MRSCGLPSLWPPVQVPTEFDAKALITDAQMESHETKAEARKSIKAVFDSVIHIGPVCSRDINID